MNLRYPLISICLILIKVSAFAQYPHKTEFSFIDSLNQAGYNLRLIDPEQTLSLGLQSLEKGKAINYKNGIAEAHRVLGISYYYLGKNDKSISHYLNSLAVYKDANNLNGQAKVYNNIGNLYKEINYEKAAYYFRKSLTIAKKVNMPDLIAAYYLNIGIIHYKKAQYKEALSHTQKSHQLYLELKNPVGITLSLQNQGVIYSILNEKKKAKKILLEANRMAKEISLNTAVASLNLSLISIYIEEKNIAKAREFLKEGKEFAILGKDPKLQSDYLKASYELERSNRNFEKALSYLQDLYTQDSIELQNTVSKKFGLFEEQSKFAARERESAIKLEQAEKKLILFWASIAVSALAFVLIFILYLVGKKKARTNKQLKLLNEQISLQTDNLNKVNQNLEEIISERTKDLQIKNRKLSEYSSHLSHQIRSPVSTMKGLMILEKENLIEHPEFIYEVTKCVNDLDDKIIHINEVLNDLSESGLIPKLVDKETKPLTK